MIRSIALLSMALLASPVLAQSVHVVDASGGGDFTTLQDAVDAAVSGDIVLVRTGVYGGFRVTKSLVVAADEGAQPIVDLDEPAIEQVVSVAAPGGFVSLLGLDIRKQTGISAEGDILVRIVSGSALIQDCVIHVEAQGVFPSRFTGVFLGGPGSATLVRTTVDMRLASGADGDALQFHSGHAALAHSGSLFLYDCELFGAQGDAAFFVPAQAGRSGVHLRVGARGFVLGCTITGGRGGAGAASPCSEGGPGGSAVRLSSGLGSGPALVLVDTVLVPGDGGSATAPCTDGSAGAPTQIQGPGTITPLAVAPRSLLTNGGVIGDGSTLTATLHGEPFDLAILAISIVPRQPAWAPAFTGAFYPGVPFITQSLGFLDANGEKVRTFQNEDPGVDVPLYLQTIHFAADQTVTLSNPRFVLLREE